MEEICRTIVGPDACFRHVSCDAGGAPSLARVTSTFAVESDWKKFRAMIPRLREKYLAIRNSQVITMLTAGNRSETERFWDAFEKMEKEAKVHVRHGHRRSVCFAERIG
jgi:hypothetical protein